jgi:UDPglucose 6-dehydrogenase
MTHLGINSSVAAADKGYDLLCYDPDPRQVALLVKGEFQISEPDLPELYAKNADRITFTTDAHALATCDLIYVAADVATDESGRSDLTQIDALIKNVEAVIRPDAVMVILSQVPPGFTRTRLHPGRPLYYQVETLIFGRAMERARFPERFIVGCTDPKQPLPKQLDSFLKSFSCPILLMRYESAELAKISINMYLVASVGVANTMAELCERTGADWAEIVPALKLDKRIGQYAYLTPGLGLAGGNLERDLATVLAISNQHGTDGGIVSAWVANSRYRKNWTWRIVEKFILTQQPGAKLAVLGLAYKEDTNSTKNSPSLALLAHLRGQAVVVYDPVVSPTDAGILFKATATALEAIQDADAVCIMTPWEEFKKLNPKDMAGLMRGHLLIDPYRVIESEEARAAGLHYITLGVAPEEIQFP